MKLGVRSRILTVAAGTAVLLATATLPQVAAAQQVGLAQAAGAAQAAGPAVHASGSDASCPGSSVTAAASSTVSAPAGVKAIRGSGSATVVWCPPAAGAGSVVSYTVTVEPGGQQVTAVVPNDWAIIDGLTDGIPYTFTVTANTKSGAASQAAASNAVTPEPIAPPAGVLRGSPRTVGYDQYSLIIGGKRIFIYAGEFDPWRTPSPSLWLDDLQKLKADGYNAVSVYFDWDYNSPSPGVYDFTGVRDYNEFLNMAQQAGLYVIARPGPNINAETDGGGTPAWVLTSPNGYRSDARPYLSAALQWYSEIDSIIAPHQITKGGDVILYQIENEYTGSSAADVQYIADLEAQARSDGINVPTTFNEPDYSTGTGAVNISGQDSYPLFAENCGQTTRGFGNPPTLTELPGEPFMSPEYQAGSLEYWGAAGFPACYDLTGPDFENVYYKYNVAQGITIQSNYMGAGGTNWGWLPDPEVYTSYDYGAAISETGELGTPADPNDIAGSKYGENKLIGDFVQAAAPLTKTVPAAAPVTDNPAVTGTSRANPGNGTQFIYLRQANASSTATVATHISLEEDQNGSYTYYPRVPQSGTITLDGRDSRLLVADYHFGGQDLVYSTSELMTQLAIGGRATALLYDPQGTGGETVLRYASQPTVTVLGGSVTATWDPSRDNLRLDYVHNGLAEVRIAGGGAPPLLLLIADTGTAEDFWPVTTAAGPALVEGGYLVRTAVVRGGTLALTGDTSQAGPLTVWAPAGVRSVTWDGSPVRVIAAADGSLRGTIPGPAPVTLPALTNWKFAAEAPEAQPGFNDSGWTLADHPVSNVSSPPAPVLYASDYGYDHGFVWYRGHFMASGSETGVTLTADGIYPTGAYSVWLNGVFLGSGAAAGPQTQTFTFPAGTLKPGQDNVIAVLVENTGNPEGPSGEKAGLYSAAMVGSPASVTWRLMGDPGGTTPQDPVRGIMNASGLYGADKGWDLPGYPDSDWRNVTLPDSWASRGVPPGIGWYRTTFSLSLPKESYVPADVRIGGGAGTGTADYRAFIYVNGWLIGRYVNNVGPQHQFYVPAGILNDHGPNTLAIAVWGLDAGGGGLDQVSLLAAGDQAGGVPVSQDPSPGYIRHGSS